MIAKTPKPPYYAVIFTSIHKEENDGYSKMAEEMEKLVKKQQGFLGFESAREGIGITISYWRDLDSIRKWKAKEAHKVAQQKGRQSWYQCYKVRIAIVDHDYDFENME